MCHGGCGWRIKTQESKKQSLEAIEGVRWLCISSSESEGRQAEASHDGLLLFPNRKQFQNNKPCQLGNREGQVSDWNGVREMELWWGVCTVF